MIHRDQLTEALVADGRIDVVGACGGFAQFLHIRVGMEPRKVTERERIAAGLTPQAAMNGGGMQFALSIEALRFSGRGAAARLAR